MLLIIHKTSPSSDQMTGMSCVEWMYMNTKDRYIYCLPDITMKLGLQYVSEIKKSQQLDIFTDYYALFKYKMFNTLII